MANYVIHELNIQASSQEELLNIEKHLRRVNPWGLEIEIRENSLQAEFGHPWVYAAELLGDLNTNFSITKLECEYSDLPMGYYGFITGDGVRLQSVPISDEFLAALSAGIELSELSSIRV